MKVSLRRYWKTIASASCLVLAVAVITPGSGPSSRSTLPSISKAEMAILVRAAVAAHTESAQLNASAERPTCPAPALADETFPASPGSNESYGVPFEAAITNTQLLSGYSEYNADHTTDTVNAATYHLSPWEDTIGDITGWITGVLQLPQLTATISPDDVVFCDEAKDVCVSAQPPSGRCAQIRFEPEVPTGEQPLPPQGNFQILGTHAAGPATLEGGQSATYTFTGSSETNHFGSTVTFTGNLGATQASAAGGLYYVGYPFDAYPNQQLSVSLELQQGKTTWTNLGAAPGPSLDPGNYEMKAIVTNESSESLTNGAFWSSIGGGSFGNLGPGKSVTTEPVTATVQPGAQTIMVNPTMSYTSAKGIAVTYSGFAVGYYTGCETANKCEPTTPDLVVSTPKINGVPAGTTPGPDTGAGFGAPYTATVTLTNDSSSPITGITGSTPSFSCSGSPGCVPYTVSIAPGATTFAVTGVAADGALEVSGTASATTTIAEWFAPVASLNSTQVSATNVTLSSQSPRTLPSISPPAPSPGNPDYRELQVTPQPLTGPLGDSVTGPLTGSSGTLASNDFTVPAFGPIPDQPFSLALALNDLASGDIAEDPSICLNKPSGCSIYANVFKGGNVADLPGWGQFSAAATLTYIGLPAGPPADFDFIPPTN